MCKHYKNMAVNQIPNINIQQPQAKTSSSLPAILPNNQNVNLDFFKKNKTQSTTADMKGKPPKVGVVDVPELSKTPLMDTLNIRKNEQGPHPILKEKKTKMNASATFGILSFAMCILGLIVAFAKKSVKKVK